MPTTTSPAPAEVAALERRIAEGVMEAEAWIGDGWIPLTEFYKVNVHPDVNPIIRIGGIEHRMSDWSPWRDPAAALEVLERLRNGEDVAILWCGETDLWLLRVGALQSKAPGDHFGPAVCLLARKVMEGR